MFAPAPAGWQRRRRSAGRARGCLEPAVPDGPLVYGRDVVSLKNTLCVALVAMGLVATDAKAQDCAGPVPDAEPGTQAWEQREAENVACGSQRSADLAANPVYQRALAEQGASGSARKLQDPLRAPERHAGRRFRYDEVSFKGHEGAVRPGAVFRPCDQMCRGMPATLAPVTAPYPAVVIVHGGSANQEMYLWASEALAEAGYLVLTFQIPNTADTHTEDLRKALDFLFAEGFPFAADLDRAHVGVAGHSGGGVAVSRVGQEDRRVSAVVSWDRAQSRPLPEDLAIRAPALYVTADFNCQRVPICGPERYATRPDPRGPGNKDVDFVRTAAAGKDAMKIALRAATHLDFSVVPTGVGSRYGQQVTSYFTLAWMDRYVRGARAGGQALAADARRRLTAATFDASADVHQLSGGTYDPATGQNVGALIAGRPVRDLLSFHFRSAWSLDGGRRVCEDIRAGGCDRTVAPAEAPAAPRRVAVCRSRRTIDVTLPRPRRGDRLRTATVQVAGGPRRRAAIRSGRRVRVVLAGLPRRTVRVRIRYTTRRGRTGVVRRTYRTCVRRGARAMR